MTKFVSFAPVIVTYTNGEISAPPTELQALWNERIILIKWEESFPAQCIELAKRQDYEHDSTTEPEREAIWALIGLRFRACGALDGFAECQLMSAVLPAPTFVGLRLPAGM